MFSKPAAVVAAVLIVTATFATAASAGIEYRGGPKSPASASVEKSRTDRVQQDGKAF